MASTRPLPYHLQRLQESVGVYRSAYVNMIDAAVQYGLALLRAGHTTEQMADEIVSRVTIAPWSTDEAFDHIFNLIEKENGP